MSSEDGSAHGPPPGLHLYTRDGFTGAICAVIRPHEIYEYSAVSGPHAPRHLIMGDVPTDDAKDPNALPTPIAIGRNDVRISVSKLREQMPYAYRNVECDELHFIQSGQMEYVTDFGVFVADEGDFVGIGRTVTYRCRPTSNETLRVILESPEPIALSPPAPFGMINFGRDLRRPTLPSPDNGPTEIRIRSFDGVTSFQAPNDPLACLKVIDGVPPVWILNLKAISPLAYPNSGGPPAQFAQTPSTSLMLFSLSSRPPHARPPQHHNADFDELIFYFRGPGAYGKMLEPGTMIWTPKGVSHWGPLEDVPEGYWAWLLEARGTMRFTEVGHEASSPMETGEFGIFAGR